MRIQHNIMAMNAYRNYNNNTSALSKNLERLSSGYKINRAGDDAAGLAISEKMRAQITGLEAAQKNVKDGVSLVNTAEGAMQEIQDMLNRMVSLATQSANGTYDNEVDRANLQAEVDQLQEEINRIAESANFNGIKLLDGSLDSSAITGVEYKTATSDEIKNLLAGNGNEVDASEDLVTTGTILETDTAGESLPQFTVELDNLRYTLTADDVKAGGADIALTIDGEKPQIDGKDVLVGNGKAAGTTLNADDIAKAYDGATIELDGVEYSAKADGTKLVFTAKEEPTKTVNPKYDVRYLADADGADDPDGADGADDAVTNALMKLDTDTPVAPDSDTTSLASIDSSKLFSLVSSDGADVITGTDTLAIGDVTVDLSGVSVTGGTTSMSDAADAIKTAIQTKLTQANSDAATVAQGNSNADYTSYDNLSVSVNANGNGFDITFDKVVYKHNGSSYEASTDEDDTVAGNASLSGVEPGITSAALTALKAKDSVKLGDQTLTVDLSTALNDLSAGASISDVTDAVAAAITNAANANAEEGDPAYKASVTLDSAGTGFEVSWSIDGEEQETPPVDTPMASPAIGGDVSDIASIDFSGDTTVSLTDDQAAALNGFTFSFGANAAGDEISVSIPDDALSAGDDLDAVKAAIKDAVVTAMTTWNEANKATSEYLYDTSSVSVEDGDYTADGTQALAATNPGFKIAYQLKDNTPAEGDTTKRTINAGTTNIIQSVPGADAHVANTTLDLSGKLTDGTQIKLGDTTYTIALGSDSAFKGANNVVYLENANASDAEIASELTHVAKDNTIFSVGQGGAEGVITLQQRTDAKESTDMTTLDKLVSYLGVSTAKDASVAKAGKALTLQIGDTSDSYNQLQVSVGDMHTSALGIDGINIGTQEGAQTAIDTIKNAINHVSAVRGTLGAISNRLDHTANNLSVMAENITDAESTIRDTDIAEEMMAYTKNNILVQSAQAMLAQANQVPQGVLQLLQ